MARRFIRTDASPDNVRAIWDNLHTLTDQLSAAQATIKQQAATLAQQTALLSAHSSKITQALAASGKVTGTSSSGTGGSSSGGSTGPAVPNHEDIVQAVLGTMPLSASSTPADWFAFIQEVVWQISLLGTDPPGIRVGLLHQDGGDGVYTCAGETYACFRLCYDNGANIKVLTGSFTGQWTPEAPVPLSDWRAPVDPASPC